MTVMMVVMVMVMEMVMVIVMSDTFAKRVILIIGLMSVWSMNQSRFMERSGQSTGAEL